MSHNSTFEKASLCSVCLLDVSSSRQTVPVTDGSECNAVKIARIGGWMWQVCNRLSFGPVRYWQPTLLYLDEVRTWKREFIVSPNICTCRHAGFRASYQVLFCPFLACDYRLWTDRLSTGGLGRLCQLHVTIVATRLMNRQAQYWRRQLSVSATCNYSSYPPYEQTSKILAASAIWISYM